MDPSNNTTKLDVKVFSPFKIFYQGPAVSLSGLNKTGPFDVLFGHAAFFSILLAGDIVINLGDKNETIPIERGIIRVTNNRVTVFTNV